MNVRDLYSTQKRVYELYIKEKFQDALEQALQAAERFPQRATTTSFWIAILYTRLGERERALAILQRAVKEGIWWSEKELKRGLPEAMNTIAERKTFICENGDSAGLYLGTGDGRIFESMDEGDTWRLIAEDMSAIQYLLLVK